MIRVERLGTLVAVLVWAGTELFAQDPFYDYRTWTDAQGRNAEMAFVGFADGKLRMQKPDGKEFQLRLDQLAEPDRITLLDSQTEKAVGLKSKSKLAEAAQLLQDIVEVNPKYAAAHLWLAKVQYDQGNFAAAAEAFRQHASLVPGDVDGPRGAARAYARAGDRNLAEFWYKKALEIAPNDQELRAEAASGQPPDAPAAPAASEPSAGTPTTRAATASPAPSSSTPSTSSGTESAAQGFWRQGLVGILGGRTVWWGRLIAVVLFSIGLLGGIAQIGTMYKGMQRNGLMQSKEQAGCAAFAGGLIGFGFTYILYWGIPTGWGWAIAVPVALFASLAAAGGATAN